jgi:hypothetical protein
LLDLEGRRHRTGHIVQHRRLLIPRTASSRR